MDYEDKLRKRNVIRNLINTIKDQDVDSEYNAMKDLSPQEIRDAYSMATNEILKTKSEKEYRDLINSLPYNSKKSRPDVAFIDLSKSTTGDSDENTTGFYDPNENLIAANPESINTGIHEQAHSQDELSNWYNLQRRLGDQYDFKSKLFKEGKGIADAQKFYSWHHQNSPLIEKDILHNLISGNEPYVGSSVYGTSGSAGEKELKASQIRQLLYGN